MLLPYRRLLCAWPDHSQTSFLLRDWKAFRAMWTSHGGRVWWNPFSTYLFQNTAATKLVTPFSWSAVRYFSFVPVTIAVRLFAINFSTFYNLGSVFRCCALRLSQIWGLTRGTHSVCLAWQIFFTRDGFNTRDVIAGVATRRKNIDQASAAMKTQSLVQPTPASCQTFYQHLSIPMFIIEQFSLKHTTCK